MVALMIATVSFAQSSMLATLSHDGEISTFYGATALRDAYNVAQHGDVITLSSGSFNAVNLTKAITIRGAGMAVDTTSQSEPTFIAGNFTIAIPDSITKRLTLEGIYSNHTITVNGNFKNGTFLKSRFSKITPSNNSTITNLTLIHCRIATQIDVSGSASFINSVICNPYTGEANVEYVNSVVIKNYYYDNHLGYSQFKNCILVARYQYYSNDNYLTSSCVAFNCVATGVNFGNMFKYIPNTTNFTKSYADIFKTFRGAYNDNETFELTDAAKTSLLGMDGTQVGIHGGNMPFSTTPTNPQITKCNVAAKSTADGKLSVDITVNGAE